MCVSLPEVGAEWSGVSESPLESEDAALVPLGSGAGGGGAGAGTGAGDCGSTSFEFWSGVVERTLLRSTSSPSGWLEGASLWASGPSSSSTGIPLDVPHPISALTTYATALCGTGGVTTATGRADSRGLVTGGGGGGLRYVIGPGMCVGYAVRAYSYTHTLARACMYTDTSVR